MSHDSPETDRNVTAFFGSRDAAERAIAHLVETGLPRDRILLRMGAARKPAAADDGKGLLQEVKELILPSEEPDAAVAALKHEGFLLSARPEADAHDAVFRLLEEDGGQGVESRNDIWPEWKSGQVAGPTDGEPEFDADPDDGATPDAAAADRDASLPSDPDPPRPDETEPHPARRPAAPDAADNPASAAG